MRISRFAIVLALALSLGGAAEALAQTGYVNPFAGVLIVDDGELTGAEIDPSGIFGGVLGFALAPGWEVAAAYGFSPVTAEVDEVEEVDANVHAYFGAVNYVFPGETPWRFLLTGGIGGLAVDPDVEDLDASNDVLVNLGGGLRYLASDRFAVQGVVRDHIHFCQGEEVVEEISLCPDDDSALHHIEISGGVLILF